MKKVISIFMSAAMCVMLMSCTKSSENMASGGNVQDIESGVVTQPDTDSNHEASARPAEIDSSNATSEQLSGSDGNDGDDVQFSASDSDNGASDQTSGSETEDAVYAQEFSNIEIEVTTGTLHILAGDTLSFVRKDGTALDYSISNGTLYVANDSSHTATLTLPGGGSYNEISLVINEGHIFAEQALSTAALHVTMNKGEASIGQISVSDSSMFNIEKGSLYIHGDIGSTVTASCDEGHLNMEVLYSQNDYNFNLEVSEGNMQIGAQGFHGRTTRKSIDNGAERNAELSCWRGDISMQFDR